MVFYPSQSHFGKTKSMLIRCGPDDIQTIEILLIPVSATMKSSLSNLGIEARPGLESLLITRVPTSQETTSQRLERIERNTIVAETREKLVFDAALKSMVDTLVNRRLDPAVLLADLADHSDFPGHVVADSKSLESALLVQLVDRSQSIFKRVGSVGPVEVEHVDLLTTQSLDTVLESTADISRGVGV
jgi:hypothetical protein